MRRPRLAAGHHFVAVKIEAYYRAAAWKIVFIAPFLQLAQFPRPERVLDAASQFR
jgi:hypothetical protein